MKPSEEEALALHRKYGSDERIVEHCRTVAMLTKILADEFARRGESFDSDGAIAAALLHDIGRSRVQTPRHGLEGSEMLEREGVDEAIAEMVRRHVGAGLSPEEAKKLGLPDYDYVPRTREQMAVCFSDKMVDGTRVRPLAEEVKRFERKGHDVGRLLGLRDRLGGELGEDPEALILRKIKGTSHGARDS